MYYVINMNIARVSQTEWRRTTAAVNAAQEGLDPQRPT
jgi:hypothetical protein